MFHFDFFAWFSLILPSYFWCFASKWIMWNQAFLLEMKFSLQFQISLPKQKWGRTLVSTVSITFLFSFPSSEQSLLFVPDRFSSSFFYPEFLLSSSIDHFSVLFALLWSLAFPLSKSFLWLVFSSLLTLIFWGTVLLLFDPFLTQAAFHLNINNPTFPLKKTFSPFVVLHLPSAN